MTLTMMLAEELIKDRHHEAERRRLASTLKPRRGRNGWSVLRKARQKGHLNWTIRDEDLGEDEFGFVHRLAR